MLRVASLGGHMRLWLALGLTLSLVRLAHADGEREQSKAHFVEGTKAFEQGDYARAIVEYEAAYKILPIPEILFNLAQAQRLKGDARKAIELYQRYVAIAPNGRAVGEAKTDIEALTAQLTAEKAAAEKAAAEKAAAEKAAAERAAAEKQRPKERQPRKPRRKKQRPTRQRRKKQRHRGRRSSGVRRPRSSRPPRRRP
jgi:tetratricopeptide (TPR) repeat protein